MAFIGLHHIEADHPASSALSIAERRAIDGPHLQALLDWGKAQKGRSVQLQANEYLYDQTLEFLETSDKRADFSFKGRGPGVTRLVQGGDGKVCLDIGTSLGNLRTFELSDMTIFGGLAAIRTEKCIYNHWHNLEMSHTVGPHTIISQNGRDIFKNSWFTHTQQALLSQTNGFVDFQNCYIGEDVGELYTSGQLLLTNCNGHSLKNVLGDIPSANRGWINLQFGGEVLMKGCTFDVQTNAFDSFIRTKNSRHIAGYNNHISMPSGLDLFIQNNDTTVWTSNFGGHTLDWRGGRLVFSDATPKFYDCLSAPAADYVHRSSTVNPLVRVPNGATLDFGDMVNGTHDNDTTGTKVLPSN